MWKVNFIRYHDGVGVVDGDLSSGEIFLSKLDELYVRCGDWDVGFPMRFKKLIFNCHLGMHIQDSFMYFWLGEEEFKRLERTTIAILEMKRKLAECVEPHLQNGDFTPELVSQVFDIFKGCDSQWRSILEDKV